MLYLTPSNSAEACRLTTGGARTEAEQTKAVDQADTAALAEPEQNAEAQLESGSINVVMDKPELAQWHMAYKEDGALTKYWSSKETNKDTAYAGLQFFKDSRKLLFFRDTNFVPRLCVLKALRASLLIAAHEDVTVTAHARYQKLYRMLANCFCWPLMKKDIICFCKSCNVCQKIKPLNHS
jgi:hypothetical protein